VRFSTARSDLDSMVVEIELTLVSIIQGVALTVLIENAHSAVSESRLSFWPYVVAGLLVIFVFWSRAVLHIITVIRWPLEFGHNFLYIACALVEAILFAQVGKPAAWFSFGAAFIALGWTLFVYDLRLIHARMPTAPGPSAISYRCEFCAINGSTSQCFYPQCFCSISSVPLSCTVGRTNSSVPTATSG